MGVVNYTVIDGEIIAETRDSVEHDYVPDPLGSTVALLDNTQTQTDTFTYWPYGEERTRTGTTATPFRFVGSWGYYHDSTARTYILSRTLNKVQGRWLAEDLTPAFSEELDLYCYVSNCPTTW